MLILFHALIYVFFWFSLVVAAVPGGVQIRGSVVFACRAMVGVAAVPGGIQIRGSRSLVCKAAAAFSLKPVEVLKFAFFLPRVLNDGFGTVRMCVAGGGDANVYTCFSVGGTGMNGVIVRRFFNAGCIEDPRVVLIVCFSLGGSCWSFCPAALSLLRGFDVAWSFVLEDVFVVVEPSLRSPWPCPRFCVVCLVLGSAAVLGGV